MSENPFKPFCKKYEIDTIRISECHGWNHSRPCIGFFSDGIEIANIHDMEIFHLSDGSHCINENCDEVSYDDEKSEKIYELHVPHMCASASNYCVLYMEEDDYKKKMMAQISEDCKSINDWFEETECCVDVYFKKDGKEISWDDTYAQFINDLWNMLKDTMTEAISQ